MHKLVVHFDDDPFITGLSAGVLRQHGITVVQRIRSDHIFEVLQRFNPGVVIMELEMQGLDGLDLIAAIKEYNPATQIIVMTRFVSTQKMISALDRGASDYLTKPLQENERLIESVKGCFDRLRMWQDQFAWLDRIETKSGFRGPIEVELSRELLMDSVTSEHERNKR